MLTVDPCNQYASNGSLKVDGLDFKFCIIEGVPGARLCQCVYEFLEGEG